MKRLLLLIPSLIFYAACTYKKGEVPEPAKNTAGDCDSAVSYASQIAPLVTNFCVGCHSPGGSGNGEFTDYAGLKQKADNGSLHNRVVVVKDMPEAGSPTLSDAERKLFDCWIKQGAPNN
ncbi:MAG: cytochrome c [Bacteroidota bacterium]|jgi:mono/diheme cytochrome c family protein|nr:cytochrome c [Bacteroidota bacterium]